MGSLQGMEKEMKKFRDFEEAREFVRTLNLKGDKEWREYCKSGNKPDDIPSNSQTTYKKEWIDVKDWLGTGWRDFEEAREFVRTLNLKGDKEWREYCKSGNKPDDIPRSPNTTYKKDFKGVGDWLGTGTVHPKNKIFRPYKEARDFARTLNLKGDKGWREYCKSGNKPDDIPSNPEKIYKKEWKELGDWTGTGRTRNFRPYKEAREFARALKLNSRKEWTEYCKSGNKPDNIPSKPERTYKKDFKGVGDWLGTGRIADRNKIFRPYKEARQFVRALNLKNVQEWQEYCVSGNKPDDIPTAPWNTYKRWKKK
jgi:hypothetical protein